MTNKKINRKSSKKNLFPLTQVEKDIQFETIYKLMMPHLNNNFSEYVAAHILLILKLEGVIGDKIGNKDIKMIEDLKENIFKDKNLHSNILNTIKIIKKAKKNDRY